MESKRGQELSTNAIIMIVIGIIVLVVLVLGFTIGWDKLLPFFSTNNVQNLQTTCNSACAQGDQYNFCALPRTVNDGVNPKFTDSCFNLSTKAQYTSRNYGITPCSSITCSS
ncbi:MAG: hypothetical protein ABSG05_02345 [Candidatus Pacearchaeota archaeon]|jgi:hypothetical protein